MVKNILLGFALSALVLASTFAFADDAIFANGAQPAPSIEAVSLDRLADSATMREHQDEVIASASAKLDKMEKDGMISPAEKIQIKGWFKGVPFQRIVDVQLSFLSGLPDMFSVCLQINPIENLSIDACAGTIVFISSLSAHVASRFLHYTSIDGKTNKDGSISYSGNTFGVGPKVGYRSMGILEFDSGGGTAQGIDTLVSAEWVHWFSRYFGMGLQLDAGATFVVQQSQGTTVRSILPNAKLSVGISF